MIFKSQNNTLSLFLLIRDQGGVRTWQKAGNEGRAISRGKGGSGRGERGRGLRSCEGALRSEPWFFPWQVHFQSRCWTGESTCFSLAVWMYI